MKRIYAIFVIFLLISAGLIPVVSSSMKINNSFLNKRIDIQKDSLPDCNGYFDDYTDDVILGFFDDDGEDVRSYRTFDEPNVNIISGSYTQNNEYVTITVEVEGEIEDIGNFSLWQFTNVLIYTIFISTSENNYFVEYCNKSCQLWYDNSTYIIKNFSVDENTLSIPIKLNNSYETIQFIEIYNFRLIINYEPIYYVHTYDAATDIDYLLDIEITKPTNNLYYNNQELFPFLFPLVFSEITIKYEELLDETQLITLAEFYIDEELIESDIDDRINLTWDEFAFGKHNVKIIVFDYYGNRASDEIVVWKFF